MCTILCEEEEFCVGSSACAMLKQYVTVSVTI